VDAPSTRVAVALLGGGLGERLGGTLPKALVPILGHPMVHYSLRTFAALPEIQSVWVACPALHCPVMERALAAYPRGPLRGVVSGGPTRAESALNVLRAMEAEAPEVVLVHDAARPCVTRDEVRDLLAALPGHDGAFLAAPCVDTLWNVEGQEVSGGLDRRALVRAFTPQAFPYATLRRALEAGIAEGFAGTDDVSFVLRQGGQVVWVPGERWNLKVTYPDDLHVVEAILGGQGCA